MKILNRLQLLEAVKKFNKVVSDLVRNDAARAFMKANPDIGYIDSLGIKHYYKESTIANYFKEVRVADKKSTLIVGTIIPKEEKESEEEIFRKKIREDIQKYQDVNKLKEAKAKYEFALRELDESNKRFDALISIKEPVDIHTIEPSIGENKHEAIPIILLSDWHFEERVDDYTINGMNHYNLEIAAARWLNCIQNSLKLVHKERHSSDIKQLILWLGGDFITGYIHEELEENNYLSPTEATRFAKEKIITAIKFYLEHGKFDKITIVCNYGNHGRVHKKPRISTGYKNSYEWMMYKDIEDYFAGNKKLEFHIPNGLFAYVNTFDNTLRFWHGDTIKYGGGIGGLTVPLIKSIHRMNQQIKADYNFMGHFHQFWEATRDCIVNGSGIGFNAYAQVIGASPEKPIQGFRLLDSKYGMTTKLPIYCE